VNSRLLTCAALAVVTAVAVTPAHAATKKKRVLKGSYTVNVNPNPAVEVLGQVNDGCDQTVPGGADNHPFTVPAAGTLKVVLEGEDPSGGAAPVGPDWDLYLLDSDGTVYDSSTDPNAHEVTSDKFKKKQTVTIQACNLLGTPNATVSYTFTYA
jgi:hypothetical protein